MDDKWIQPYHVKKGTRSPFYLILISWMLFSVVISVGFTDELRSRP